MRTARPRRAAPPPDHARRIRLLAGAFALAFLVLLVKLWHLQLIVGDTHRIASEQNRVRVRPVAAPRGVLLDRHGVPLVDNRPAFTLVLHPRELPRDRTTREAVLGRLAALLRVPYGELTEAVERVPPGSLQAVRVRRALTLEEVARVEEWRSELPGVAVDVEPQRAYPTSGFAAHLLGYVREATEDQVRGGYRRGDPVGQTGLERVLDRYLRGRDGGERVEVDAQNRAVRLLERVEPEPGAQVITTIDRRIQEVAERELAGRSGAIVVLDPRTGDLRALASSPAVDNASFSRPLDPETWRRIVEDSRHPLLNRALQAQYAPGSIFKLVVAAAGLQEAVLVPTDRVRCAGSFTLGTRTFNDWKPEGHGSVDLRRALGQSCNVYFYQAGLRVGPATIARYADAFGLGQATRVDLPGEKYGLVPRPGSGRGRWQGGDTLNVAIGQGELLVTPVQVARLMGAVANGGVLWKPRLVARVEGAHAGTLWRDPGQVTGHVELAPAVWALLRQGLHGAVSEDGGTGAAARVPGLEVAGKTGTAQARALRRDGRRGDLDHAWFAGFAPLGAPEAVVVVVVERGGAGGQAAAPIARRILEALFMQKVAAAGLTG